MKKKSSSKKNGEGKGGVPRMKESAGSAEVLHFDAINRYCFPVTEAEVMGEKSGRRRVMKPKKIRNEKGKAHKAIGGK